MALDRKFSTADLPEEFLQNQDFVLDSMEKGVRVRTQEIGVLDTLVPVDITGGRAQRNQ